MKADNISNTLPHGYKRNHDACLVITEKCYVKNSNRLFKTKKIQCLALINRAYSYCMSYSCSLGRKNTSLMHIIMYQGGVLTSNKS